MKHCKVDRSGVQDEDFDCQRDLSLQAEVINLDNFAIKAPDIPRPQSRRVALNLSKVHLFQLIDRPERLGNVRHVTASRSKDAGEPSDKKEMCEEKVIAQMKELKWQRYSLNSQSRNAHGSQGLPRRDHSQPGLLPL